MHALRVVVAHDPNLRVLVERDETLFADSRSPTQIFKSAYPKPTA